MRAFCPFCEKEYNNLEIQTRYEITTLNGVTAEWQKKYIVCPDCGEELYNGEIHDANLRVVYDACKVSDIDKPVEDLCDYVLKLRMENAELRERLKKAVELPVKVGNTIYCIRNCGTGRYRVEEHTVTEIVFEYDNQMRIKTSYGLFGCEKWTFGLDCFADNAEAEARLKELQGGER